MDLPATIELPSGGEISHSVLLVESDSHLASVMYQGLESFGFQISHAESRDEGLEFLRELPPDVVVCAMHLAVDKSGSGFLVQMKEIQPGIPLIVVAESGDFNSVAEALRSGAIDSVARSASPEILAAAIKRAAEQSRQSVPSNREVLVLGANPTFLDLMKDTLERGGFKVFGTTSIAEGLQVFQQFDVDVVMIPWEIEGTAGLVIFQELRELRVQVPCLVVTENPSPEHEVQCLRAGVFDYVDAHAHPDAINRIVQSAHDKKSEDDARRLLEFEQHLFQTKLEQLGQRLEDEVDARTEELARMKRLSDNILEAVPSGMVLVDLEGVVNAANPAGLRILRLDRAAVIGRRVEIVPTLAPFADKFDGVLSTGESIPRAEQEICLESGETRIIGYTLAPLASSLGGSLGAVLHVKDITDQNRFLRGLDTMQRISLFDLQMVDVSKHLLSSSTALAGRLELLANRFPGTVEPNPEIRNILQLCRDISSRFFGSTGSLAIDPFSEEEIDFGMSLTDALDTFLDDLGQKRIRVRSRIDDAVGLVWGDRYQLHQMLMLMVLRVRQSMPNGGLLDIELREFEGRIHLTLFDDGLPFRSEDLAFLSDPRKATQGVPYRTQQDILLCSRIVEYHRGSMEIEPVTEPDSGNRFRITIPSLNAFPKISVSSAVSTTPPAVLIVEGDDSLARLMELGVRALGLEVERVRDGCEAVAELNRRSFAAIVIDVQLPDISGVLLGNHIAQARGRQPLGYVCALPLSASARQIPVLQLPFDCREFGSFVRGLFATAQG